MSLFTALLHGDCHEIVIHSLVVNFLFFEGLQKESYLVQYSNYYGMAVPF